MVEGIGSLQLAAQSIKKALKDSGVEAATNTVVAAKRAGEEEAAKHPQTADSKGEGNPRKPARGFGLGQHVDITV